MGKILKGIFRDAKGKKAAINVIDKSRIKLDEFMTTTYVFRNGDFKLQKDKDLDTKIRSLVKEIKKKLKELHKRIILD